MKRPKGLAAVALTVLGLILVVVGTPSSLGAYTSKVTNSKNTASSSVWATTCLAQAKADSAYFFYPLSDTAGPTVTDSSNGTNRPGTYSSSGVAYRDTRGPCTNDNQGRVVTLDGSTGAIAGTQYAGSAPTDFTEEVWFKTSTTTGGDLMSVSPVQTGTSNQHDRHLYINPDGKLVAGIYDGTVRTIQSTASYNNNAWHHAVFTVATTGTYKGMRLYVDGNATPVASTTTYFTAEAGTNLYIRIGYNNLSGWPTAPNAASTPYFFKGSLADVAFYSSVLTPTQVTAHYNASN